MTEPFDFWPLFSRTEAEVRADFDTRANAGLNPGDPDWVDTAPPGFFFIATQPMVTMYTRQVDRMNEIAAAAILATSWGRYLDYHAESYGQERKQAAQAIGEITFTGSPGTLVGTGVQMSPVQTDPEIEPPIFATTASGVLDGGGTLTLAIEALFAGTASNVGAGEITFLVTGVPGIESLTNANATGGGTETETDIALKRRLQGLVQGGKGGTIAQYTQWALEQDGVGYVTVIPVWAGPGTVLLIILDDDRNPAALPVVQALQTRLDPVPGQGMGLAPIDHTVSVATPASVQISVAATGILFKPGFSLDGANGTVATRGEITGAVDRYVDSLGPGDDVIHNNVRAAFFEVEGLLNVPTLTVNGHASNDVAISTSPAQVAQINTITLS